MRVISPNKEMYSLDFYEKRQRIGHWINGQMDDSGEYTKDIFNPATDEKINEVFMGGEKQVEKAVESAKAALPSWSNLSPLKRSRILFKYKELIEKNKEEIAKYITMEHGKVFSDALGEVQRGLEVVEFACGIPHLLKGEFSHQVASSMDCYSIQQPVGVCVGITPFNFPVMVPMWMFPIALACGNTFVLKPSEKDPSSTMKIVELLQKAGLPDGVLNVVHGEKTVVERLIDHPDVAAVSFVGSTPVAQAIYQRASMRGKRVQALGGAKNHCVVMPDADLQEAVQGLMGAAYGSAGERCMAISVAVAVGKATGDYLIESLANKIDELRVGLGYSVEADMGPVISREHQKKIRNYIDLGVKQGATLIRDGRVFSNQHPEGYFIGPTLFDHVATGMTIYQEEIFGPVLSVIRVNHLDDAISLVNQCRYANGSAIYTSNGNTARRYSSEIEAGMVGINVPIPVPMAFHSFGGWKSSLLGDTHIHGKEGVRFYTRTKTITTRWDQNLCGTDNKFVMPTLQ